MIKMLQGKKGFTLIELIIVIAILAILALIGLPLIGQYMADAQIAQDNATAQVIGRAAEAFIAANPGTTSIDYAGGDLDAYLNANARGLSATVTIDASGNVSVAGPGAGAYPSAGTSP